MSTFTTIKPFEFWTQHVLPLVYGEELSYMEVHDKIVYLLNELIKNNNQLPEYIQQIVQEYITSGTLEEVIRNVVSNFILNVKYPPNDIKPAVGDGTAIDTEAIQGCIDYASSKGGGVVYFPYGKYLTESLVLKDNVSLFGFGKYATKLVLSGGASNALVSGEVTGCSIANISLDGNAGIQVNEVDCISVVAGDFQMDNVVVTDGHNLVNIQKNGGNVELNNIEFKNGVEALLRIGGTTGTLHGDTLMFGRVSDVKGIAGVISDADGDMLTGIVTKEQFNVFAQLDGTGNYLSGVVKANTYVNGTGVGNSFDFIGSEKAENYSGKAERKAGEVSETVSGNSNRNVSGNDVTVVDGDMNTTVHQNRSVHVDGANTFAVDGNSTESVDGNKSETVTGITQETYTGDKTVNGNNQTETFKGKKITNATDIILNPTNPLTYKAPKKLNDYFNYIEMKDNSNNKYKVLCYNDTDITELFTTPEKYGAKGDGVTDDTNAFIEMLKSDKNILLSKDKTYIVNNLIINSPLILNMNGATLKTNKVNSCITIREKTYICNGTITTDIVYNSSGNAIKIEGNGNYSIVENININGFITGVYCSSVNNIKLINLNTKNHVYLTSLDQGGYNILLEKSKNIEISGCLLYGGANARHCIYISDGNENVNITNNLLELTSFVNAKEPVIYIRENNNINISNNIIIGGTYSVFVSGTKNSCKNIIINGNNFSGIIPKASDNGKYVMITLSEDGSTKPNNVVVTGNTISNENNRPTAFFVIGDNVSITGNSVIGNYSNVFELSNCKCFITGNNVINTNCSDKPIKVSSGVSGEINGFHGQINNTHTGALYMDLNFNNEIDISISSGQITTNQIIEYASVSYEGELLQVKFNNIIINREYITAYIIPYNSSEKFEITCNYVGGGIYRFTIYKNGQKINANTFIGKICVRI